MEETAKKQQVPKIDVFKGNPVIILNPEDKFIFSFGLMKAKLIIQNFDAIKAFVDANDKKDVNEA